MEGAVAGDARYGHDQAQAEQHEEAVPHAGDGGAESARKICNGQEKSAIGSEQTAEGREIYNMAEVHKLGSGRRQGETGDDDGVGLELARPARRTVQGSLHRDDTSMSKPERGRTEVIVAV